MTIESLFASDKSDEKADIILAWEKRGGLIGLPLTYGLEVADYLSLDIVDNRCLGQRVTYRQLPSPRNDQQRQFFDSLTKVTKNHPAAFAVAPTGTGKTVAALQTIASLGRAALVVVPTVNLATQWREEAVRHLGCSPDRVHIFSGGDCKWEGTSIVIAVVHNLCIRKWPSKFYSHFGTVVWDEAHRMAAKWFSISIKRFPARYRIALTATPNRKDGKTELLNLTFGPPSAKVKGNRMKALPCTAYVVNTSMKIVGMNYGNPMMKLATALSSLTVNEDRNTLLADIVCRGYEAGRDIVILSDRIEQLREIMRLCESGGIPIADLSLFISSTGKAEVSRLKESSPVIFATYGMMKEGQDIPRLDMGVDASPRSEGTQAVGRIRREFDVKHHPIWVTLFDKGAPKNIQRISSSRIKDYLACGVRVINVNKNLSRIPF